MVIDGKQIAEKIYAECESMQWKKRFLALFYSDETPATQSFIKQKRNAANRLGIELREHQFDEKKLREIAGDDACGGIVLQLPLGDENKTQQAIKIIPPTKDIDNLSGNALLCTPAVGVVEQILNEANNPKMDEIAIVGQGVLVGKPVAKWAKESGNRNIRIYDKGFDPHDLKTADLVVSGAGEMYIFSAEHLKKGAFVIDFGYTKSEAGSLVGDFNPAGAKERDIVYTPTPGGTGPILVACLMRNFCIVNGEKNII